MQGVMIMMRGLWYKVPADLFNDSGISKADMAVFAYVADRLKGDTKAVSVSSIAAATELSRRQVQYSLRNLCLRNYLIATERPGLCTMYTQRLIPIKGKGPGDGSIPEPPSISCRAKEVS